MSDYKTLKAQIAELEKQAEEARKKEIKEAVQKIHDIMREYGLEAKDLGFGLELVSARNALAKIGIEHPAEVPVGTARPKKDGSLPMPAPLPPRNMPAEKGKVVK